MLHLSQCFLAINTNGHIEELSSQQVHHKSPSMSAHLMDHHNLATNPTHGYSNNRTNSWLPEHVTLLARFSGDPLPVKSTVTKAVAEFRRTHADTWNIQKDSFTEEQLEVLADTSSSSSCIMLSPFYNFHPLLSVFFRKREKDLRVSGSIPMSDSFFFSLMTFHSVLKGYKLFDYFDGSANCPSKFVVSAETEITKEVTVTFQEWETVDLALLSLLMATLSDDAIEQVIGCKTAAEAWANLEDIYASVSKIGVNHLKTELHTMQKGGDSMAKYLLRIKSIRDQLIAAGEYIFNNDVMIAALAGLPKEYATIRTVILAREFIITMKEFRALLLGAERENDVVLSSLTQSMAALYMHNTNVGAMSFGSQNQMGQPAYFSDQTSYGSKILQWRTIEGKWQLQDKVTRKILYKRRSRPQDMFQIPMSSWKEPSAFIGQLVKSSLWHQRLGHPTNEVLAVMLAKSKIPVTIDNKHAMCTNCIHGKITRKPFSNDGSRCVLPFDRIHFDVWGFSFVKSTEGYRFYVVFVDDCTRYMWIFPLYNKSEVFSVFVKFYKYVEVQFGI
ncbi:hypothetical protein D8674_006993 [Pyrus ussuriensis x Pyrus communis]|uniref:GAG-pre-integrase domain-containing protein n=1 Tax=Pyrus ussuriensis x Pyrus communis TaxID=2448454 RepID=A0A5N5FVW3_9ROSA|nr:hypothetical protein D8674_006993 [Pyrus ussuriensis x Pyrus communis]